MTKGKKILWGASGSSMNLSFLVDIDYVIEAEWERFNLFKKIFYELYWRIIFKRFFSKACYSLKKLKTCNPQNDIIFLGNIFKRESSIPILEQYGFIPDVNLFEAFDLSPTYCAIRRNGVTQEEIRLKDYENDELKLKIMSTMVPSEIKSICDVGCGSKKLLNYISSDINYCGIDYIQTGPDIINCDLNREKFPRISVDCFFCCGILEFITDWKTFLSELVALSPLYIILSYSAREYSSLSTTRSRVYHNSIYSSEIVSEICKFGYELDKFVRYESRQVIYRFKKVDKMF